MPKNNVVLLAIRDRSLQSNVEDIALAVSSTGQPTLRVLVVQNHLRSEAKGT